jgi:hypothetical protein
MTKTYQKQAKNVFIPITDLKKYLSNYQIFVFEDHVNIKEIDYEESFQRDLNKAKNAADSDFVNL